jgi:hypothetical protein
MILQFAKLPPPIGGITIHVKRLVLGIKQEADINVEVLDYSREKNIKIIFKKIFKAKVIHVHLSRQSHRLLFIIIFKFLLKKVIVTFHGKKDFSNKFDYWSLLLANRSIVLNESTLKKAKEITSKVSLIGAFIPPLNKSLVSTLKDSTIFEIQNLKAKCSHCFSTNAFKVVFDGNKEEIYGGSLLTKIFKETPNIGLVFSDPTGEYKTYLLEKFKALPDNVLFINYSHDFIDVINITDCVIRATTTDGDPLSVKESLFFKTDAICSNVIQRPAGTIIYDDENNLKEKLINYENYKGEFANYLHEDNLLKLIQLYKK